MKIKNAILLMLLAMATLAARCNNAPTASFVATPLSGDVSTEFQFDASGSGDVEDSESVLEVRWDWENDGTWDTSYSTAKTESHHFDAAGVKTIRLEVRDSGNLSDTATSTVTVTDGGVVPHGLTNLFFLHHSTGDAIVVEGGVRDWIDSQNAAHGTFFAFWDHGYNYDGLRNPEGEFTGTSYDIPDDNTDPDGLYRLWTGSDSSARNSRNSILANHEVIAFKSCFPASAIYDAQMLQQYKTWYRAMRDVFDARTDRLFVVIPPPPLHRRSTNSTQAAKARAFASWLCGSAFLDGHPNVQCFNLFDYLARADDGHPTANMLRYEYEQSHWDGDSHPNRLANETVGPILAQFLVGVAASY